MRSTRDTGADGFIPSATITGGPFRPSMPPTGSLAHCRKPCFVTSPLPADESLRLSRLVLQADLRLVDLTGLALRRFGLTRGQLLEAPARCYRQTACWAEALHEASSIAHGLMWVSRQFDTARAVVLFGDRVGDAVLRPAGSTEPLDCGRGFRRVCEAAGIANVAVIH